MIKVLKPGLYATVQDLGRFGFHDYGVPNSGVMDEYAMKIANVRLGNNVNDAVIEMSMIGGVFQFENDTLISISGADMQPKLNNITIDTNKAIYIKAGDILSFSRAITGFRTYIAVKGGIKTPIVMQSRSMYKGVTKQQHLVKNDILPIAVYNSGANSAHATLKVDLGYINSATLSAYKGPEFELLTDKQQQLLVTLTFSISKLNNRMAYQLTEPLNHNLDAIITAPVLPGTVQLTPSGTLIVLMKDCQVTGGYPRVLQLQQNSLNTLAQKQTGQQFSFKLL
ncbi:biotin-dependent carboxyltransferase family protein [Formosa sediminum]|uniref:Biotin-dependent carboxyltransferase family protein n=1 Tax=Formosa sediminum TaxID=2594004 RepID=A0A516GTN3_9FLAO|nr:biotin-dependent carboxyltransferase family protein [Formosa sediminum]QDO94889.1 biotin-dependent carboxyltransferase family protein [Formosa sediminum]